MQILTAAAKLGATRAQESLDQMVLAIADPDAPHYDEDEYGNAMRSAVIEVRRRRLLMPLALAERFARAKRPNLFYEGISAIAAYGDRVALDLLMILHSEASEWGHKTTVESTIETLSAKLGLVIRRSNGALVIDDQDSGAERITLTKPT